MKPTGDGRDQAFDRLLGREFSRPAATVDACPQVELLSAWFDRALPAEEAAGVEAHLASCVRCQEVLGHLGRTEPEVLYVHPRTEPTPWTWHLRWAVPVAAVAVAVFIVGTRSLLAPDAGIPAHTQMAQNADRALPSEPTVGADRPAGPLLPVAGLPRRSLVPGGSSAPTTGAPAAAKAEAPVRSRDALLPSRVLEELPARDNAAPASAPAPTPPQRLPAKLVTQSPAAVGAVPGMRAVESAPSGSAAAFDARAELSAFVPGSPVGWRYALPGIVLRTLDGGTSWTEQVLPVAVPLRAMSAVSPSVCWAVGAAGTLLRTSDGTAWHAMKSPTAADLVSIAALDDHRATVRTADGVTYDTADAGATWRRR